MEGGVPFSIFFSPGNLLFKWSVSMERMDMEMKLIGESTKKKIANLKRKNCCLRNKPEAIFSFIN